MKAIRVYSVLLDDFIYGGGNGDKIYPRTTSSKDSMFVVVVALCYQHLTTDNWVSKLPQIQSEFFDYGQSFGNNS